MLISIFPTKNHQDVVNWLKNDPVNRTFALHAKHGYIKNPHDVSKATLIDFFFQCIPEYTDNGTFITDDIVLYIYENWDDIMN